MKKLLILFLALVIVGGLAFGGPINITLSATSTLKWRLVGTLLDTAPGAIWHPLSGVTVSQSSEGTSGNQAAPTSTGDYELAPATLYLSMDVQDANKMSIVRAQSTIDMTADAAPLYFSDDAFSDIFHYIEFPNAVPGMLGIMLHKKGTLSTAETTATSNLSYPQVIATLTPMKDATIVFGMILQPDALHVTGASTTNDIDNVASFAASLDATYKLGIGSGTDSVTIGLGTIYDTSWSSGIIIDSAAGGFTKDVWVNFVAKQLPVAFGEKYGWANIPFGLTVSAVVSGLTVDAAAQARLVTGFDQLDKDPSKPAATQAQAWEMPLYGKLAVTYALKMDPMVITPSVTFKYSSDFWKWWYNTDYTVGAYEYLGLVAGADIIGRPMSLAASVNVTGIAKMLDVKATATLGFGDAKHAQGAYIDPNTSAVVASTIGYTTLADYATATKATKDGVTDAIAYKLGLVATLKPMPVVMIKNETYYNHDGFGVVGASSGTRWAGYLNRFQDILTGEYYLKVADAVAATFYGVGTFTIKYFPDTTTPYSILNYATHSVASPTTDVASQTTFGYEVGVYVSVKY